MSVQEKFSSLPSSSSAREVDPLLKDLNERKQSFRRNVVSLAAELKEARSRLSSQEQSFAKETQTRQEAETKANIMEQEIGRLHAELEERDGQLKASATTATKYLHELDGLRLQLVATQATADASAASAQSAQNQCLVLLKELDEKNTSIKEYEDRVKRLGEQLDNLQKDLQARESSQKQLKDEVMRVEHDILEALAKSGVSKDCELRKILDEVSPRNLEKINKLLIAKDEEIAKLKNEIKMMSAHWKLKTKELESQVCKLIWLYCYFLVSFFVFIYTFSFSYQQLEKQRRADQELKKRVLKLEFCLQEARTQTRKLQRIGERREKAIKELRDQLAGKQGGACSAADAEKHNFWETSGFKVVVSMSMLVLVVFSKR
ncbi:nuclear envelope-associated protein 2 isoform X1 [Cucumis sativus]|uniref:nuclear envelope-associated protein 2 isoform X1 n=1 Tax=Cucumis sativus TaxID=3659 RepID=UPI0012F4781B|nr:nuclear envelope-associated protein 2 isoform X1 [Cucumis sativus]